MIKDNLPKVWVLMSTYNGMDYIEEQIESILSQTNCDHVSTSFLSSYHFIPYLENIYIISPCTPSESRSSSDV